MSQARLQLLSLSCWSIRTVQASAANSSFRWNKPSRKN